MANQGVPPGGKYPSKQELGALLRQFTGSSDPRNLNVDRRRSYGKQMGRLYDDQLNARDINDPFLPRNTESYTINGIAPGEVLTAGAFYNPQNYRNYNPASDDTILASGGDQSAFVQWDIPTSSTNYSRPRTVAAGYDPDRRVMTVVFRDGTFYNYYEVSPSEWESFHASYSKGRPWLNKKSKSQSADGLFIHKPRGEAGDMSDINPQIREALYRVARAQQLKVRESKGRTTRPLFKTGKGASSYYGLEQSTRGRKREQMEVIQRKKANISYNSAKRGGVNPATANRRRKAS